MESKEKRILTATEIDKFVKRISHQIVEKNSDEDELAIVGIHTRGVPLGERIVSYIKKYGKKEPFFGVLDIVLYRDDLTTVAEHPIIKKTEIDFDINNRVVVLVDDVLYTGRTARCAMDALVDFGRPKKIQLAVLIDRGHRELPIRPDYVGKNLPTSKEELIDVRLKGIDGNEEVVKKLKSE